MHVNKHTAFYYHADANAFGGHLIYPLQRAIQARSSVSLAQAGGYGHAREEGFDLDGLLSFESARATVSGVESHEDNGWRSVATTSVERLNILDVVTADRLVSQVSVTHFRDRSLKPQISFVGTQFVNLRVNGQPVEPVLDTHLLYGVPSGPRDARDPKEKPLPCVLPTFESLISRAEGPRYNEEAAPHWATHAEQCCDEETARERDDSAGTEPPLGSRFRRTSPAADLRLKGSALCSMVESVTVQAPATSLRHGISVPDFGNIFLGELRLTLNSAQLTMLRVELGCIANGTLSAASAFSNGRTAP